MTTNNNKNKAEELLHAINIIDAALTDLKANTLLKSEWQEISRLLKCEVEKRK